MKKPVYCCRRAKKTNFLSHDKDCLVWSPPDDPRRAAYRAKLKANPDDGGQGDGCEGGKCEIRRLA